MGGAFEIDVRDARVAGGLMLGAAAVLPLLPEGAGVPCPLRTVTGVPCPLCGMTTSVEATVRLDLADAFAANPGGLVVTAVAVLALIGRPATIRLPAPLIYATLALLWLFELERFSVI